MEDFNMSSDMKKRVFFVKKSALMLSIENAESMEEQFTVKEFDNTWDQQDNEEVDFGKAMNYYYSKLEERG